MPFRDMALEQPGGLRYHRGALAYAIVACALGFAGLFGASGWVNTLAVLLLAHGMTISAQMLHECAHGVVFVRREDDRCHGRLLMWIWRGGPKPSGRSNPVS